MTDEELEKIKLPRCWQCQSTLTSVRRVKQDTYYVGCIDCDNKRLESVLGELEASRLKADRALAEAERMRTEYEHFKRESEAEIERRLKASEKELENARRKKQGAGEGACGAQGVQSAYRHRVCCAFRRRARES